MPDDSEPAPRTLREERTPSPMRRTIANRLQESYREAVHVTVSREVDAEALLAAADTAGVSILDVLLRTLSDALAAHPAFNATFEDDTHRLYEEHNVGVAVTIDDGLVAPVIPDVSNRSVDDIATERNRLTEAVQAGDYAMAGSGARLVLNDDGTIERAGIGLTAVDITNARASDAEELDDLY